MKLLLILFSSLFMNACGCQKKILKNDLKSKKIMNQKETLSGNYLISLYDYTNSSSKKINLNFNPITKKISGFSGCNRFFGNYTAKNGSIKFDEISGTEMYCGDNVDILEKKLLKTLSKATTYRLKEGILTLQINNKDVLRAESEVFLKKQQEKNNILVYEESTRGFFLELVLQENVLLIRKDRNSEKATEIKISKADMETVQSLISEIKLEKINTLEAPTKKRHFDGATHARLTITKNGKQYKGASFDGGHPPKELEALIYTILSLSKK